jgi:hypothetical protein
MLAVLDRPRTRLVWILTHSGVFSPRQFARAQTVFAKAVRASTNSPISLSPAFTSA